MVRFRGVARNFWEGKNFFVAYMYMYVAKKINAFIYIKNLFMNMYLTNYGSFCFKLKKLNENIRLRRRRKFFEIPTILMHFQKQFFKLSLHTGGISRFPPTWLRP